MKPVRVLPYCCPACGREFHAAHQLRDHLAAKHTIVSRDMRPWRTQPQPEA